MRPDPWPESEVIDELNALLFEQIEERGYAMSDQSPVVSIDTISAALLEHIEPWLQHVIGCARVDYRRGEWRAARVTGLVVRLKDGIWRHRAGGAGSPPAIGDLLALYAYVHQVPMVEAFTAARDWLIDVIGLLSDADGGRLAQCRRRAERQAATRMTAQQAITRRIWLRDSRPELLGTPVERYLASRGVSLRQLGAAPGCLKFAPDLEHPQLGRRLPAMVAAFTDPGGAVTAIHRTWLVQRGGSWDRVRPEHEGRDGTGRPIEGRLSLGPWRGTCIRLWAGGRGGPWRQGPVGSTVTLTESIENGLALARAMPDRHIGVTGSLAGLGSVKLPLTFSRVCLAPNREDDNPQAQAALRAAIKARRVAGRQVIVVAPPLGVRGWDDILRHGMPRRPG